MSGIYFIRWQENDQFLRCGVSVLDAGGTGCCKDTGDSSNREQLQRQITRGLSHTGSTTRLRGLLLMPWFQITQETYTRLARAGWSWLDWT